MTRAAPLIPTLLVGASLVLACGTDKPAAPSKVEIDSSQSEAEPAARDGAPKIASDAAVHEFGAIKATDSIDHVFKILNLGTADLIIERVQRT